MSLLHSLRTAVRCLGLQKVVSPVVAWVENRRLSSLGTYTAERLSPTEVHLSGFGKSLILTGLPPHLADLAVSSHERPTMTIVLRNLHSHEVAWDVGANEGLYTRLMSATVGASGRVVAFEPDPATFGRLATGLAANVTPVPKALSDHDGSASFASVEHHSSAGRIVSAPSQESLVVTVAVARADSLVASDEVPAPAFLKIDVEGHELAVLRGMQTLLSSPACKTVLVEVHFAILAQNGQPGAADEIARIFTRCGLTRQLWIARSHLLAERP